MISRRRLRARGGQVLANQLKPHFLFNAMSSLTELAQGQVLANQLKPHFLFNAMSSLTELIDTDAKRGAEMAQRLSELFRRIANSAEHATMPLATELAIVRDYLEIEEVRLGTRPLS